MFGYRKSIHLKYCRIGDYAHTSNFQSLYSASQLGTPPWPAMRPVNLFESLQTPCLQEHCGRSLRSKKSCWSWASFALTSYAWLAFEARMGGSRNQTAQNLFDCFPEDSSLFQNWVFLAFASLSFSEYLASKFPMGSSEFPSWSSLLPFYFRCLWKHLRTRPSKFEIRVSFWKRAGLDLNLQSLNVIQIKGYLHRKQIRFRRWALERKMK